MHGQHVSTLALEITSLRLEGLVDGEVGGGHGCQRGREYDDDEVAATGGRHVHGSAVGRSLCAVRECGVWSATQARAATAHWPLSPRQTDRQTHHIT